MKKILLKALFIFATVILASHAFAQNADYYYSKANSSLTSGKMTEAVNYYNQAINTDNKFFEAYMGLSIAYREQGNYIKALDSIQYAIKLKPDYFQAYYNMGLILEKQKKYNEAIAAYNKFLDEVPGAAKFSDAKIRISKIKDYVGK